jgi:ketosteroid isomerase-like protein
MDGASINRRQKLRDAIVRRDDAYKRGDIEGYLSFYAEDSRTFLDGTLYNFAESASLLRHMFAGDDNPVLEINLPPPDDVVFNADDTAATATHVWWERFRFPDGKVQRTSYFETDVWFYRDEQWRLVRIHLSSYR